MKGKPITGKAGLKPLLGQSKPSDPEALHIVGKSFVGRKEEGTQGAGLYVAGEVPNRVLHQQHKDASGPIRGDHFELPKEALPETRISPRKGGVSSSDLEFQAPNFRGTQYRASTPIPQGWELRNDGKEVEGSQSAGHYSLRSTVLGKTLDEAGKVSHSLFQEEIGKVKKNHAPFEPIPERARPKPMAEAWPSMQPADTRRAQSQTRVVSTTHSESFTQTHFKSPLDE